MRSAVCLLFLLSLAPVAFAAGKEDVSLDTASLDKDVTSVYGTDCEKVKPGEARSTVRVRVTDKASYLAVSSLPDLRNAKVELNEHDFNVMVYNLVDNNIEDMAIRTTKQTPEEICVEVTGYISGKNIFAAIDEALDRQKRRRRQRDGGKRRLGSVRPGRNGKRSAAGSRGKAGTACENRFGEKGTSLYAG